MVGQTRAPRELCDQSLVGTASCFGFAVTDSSFPYGTGRQAFAYQMFLGDSYMHSQSIVRVTSMVSTSRRSLIMTSLFRLRPIPLTPKTRNIKKATASVTSNHGRYKLCNVEVLHGSPRRLRRFRGHQLQNGRNGNCADVIPRASRMSGNINVWSCWTIQWLGSRVTG
ncbi:hypothetical protein BS50DRAFT_402397 [Corynespora cassiicola Philippines]|uniref:Uncharacterized protein n=1 Tax=Corynespora cassiicola Philippines TaxID=1448308 RepID=A0A2T2NKS9_CORCC|nr:hypothetical protein BS50DRAFT_402397 [Corynespora cassiicola Philippines]